MKTSQSGKLKQFERELCPVVRSVSLIGDKWVLLILRDAFMGTRKFDGFRRHLGISKSVLSAKLKNMVESGLLERQEYKNAGRRTRYEYQLTDSARDFAKVLIALMEWGNTHLGKPGEHTLKVVDRNSKSIAGLSLVDDKGKLIDWKDLHFEIAEL